MSGIPIVSSDATTAARPMIRVPFALLRRGLFFGLVTLTTLVGIALMLDIVRDNGITALEIVILGLFAVTFGWIGIAFWNAVIGFVLVVARRDPLSLERVPAAPNGAGPIASRTALVMPVHNEDPARVMSGLAAMRRSIDRTGHGDRFDVHLLSDTTDPAIAREEETAWTDLCQQLGGSSGLHYRRRATNAGRKAGNIADFCQRWRAEYDFMVVLDADSIVSGAAVVALARTMEANPRVGLIQTVPIPARQVTLFGRLVQFAGCLYGPMLAAGQSFWQTDAANYFGHNAIVRVGAFADDCRLPVLAGRPPLGGPILSHDFVEAALMRRAGWQVYLLPSIGDSYEEVPGTIPEYATRDRRWSQGSLQHLRLLPARGLHAMNRLHFLLGAMGYVSSLLWLLLLLAGTAYVLLPALSADPLLPGGLRWLPNSSLAGMSQVIPLLAVTVVVLFAPKFLALIQALARRRQSFGGAGRLLLSALLEILFAVVIAPVMMMHHTRFVVSVLGGHDIEWAPQLREGRVVGWPEAWRTTSGIATAGLLWAGLTLYHSPAFSLWLTPIFTGLLLAGPLVRWTSSRSLGQWTRHRGLFLVPSETTPPPELQPTRSPVDVMSPTGTPHGPITVAAPSPERSYTAGLKAEG